MSINKLSNLLFEVRASKMWEYGNEPALNILTFYQGNLKLEHEIDYFVS